MILKKMQQATVLGLLALTLHAGAQVQPRQRFDYGMSGSLNYTTTGTVYSNYSGAGSFSLGGFVAYHWRPLVTFAFEPAYTSNSFREVQVDINYQYNYLDFNLNTYVDLFRSEALWLYAGIRPGYLFNYSTRILKSGTYEKVDTSINRNQTGQLDIGINAGLSVKISPLIDFHLGYMWSATDRITAGQIKGRPSYVEAGIRLNALDLKQAIESKEEQLIRQIKTYQRGALYIMLPTPSVKALARMSPEEAEAARTESSTRNRRVMQVFRSQYSFTPLYFFMDTSVSRMLSGNTSGIFVDDNLAPDTSIAPAAGDNFFVASFCSDLSNHNQKISYGLFVYDHQMVQLGRPFNVPSQIFGALTEGDPTNFFGRKNALVMAPYERAVRKLNGRLLRYAGN